MLTTLDCIALRRIRHNDKHDILTAYSRQQGRVAFVISSARGREAARRRALLMPMSIFRSVSDTRPGRDLLTMRELTPVCTPACDGDPVRAMLAIFAGDLLNALLSEPVSDPLLYTYIEYSVGFLTTLPPVRLTNYHLTLMVGLMRFMGIEPDLGTWRPGMLFDPLGGVFRHTPPLAGPYYDREESQAAATLLRMTYRNMHRVRLTRDQRNRAVDYLLGYYNMHHRPVSYLPSLAVLRDMS